MKEQKNLQDKELKAVNGGSHEPVWFYCPKCDARIMREDSKFVKRTTSCGTPIYAYRCPECGHEFDE